MKRSRRLVLLCGLLFIMGCGATSGTDSLRTNQTAMRTSEPATMPAPRAIIYYMHRTYRCPTCLNMEKLTLDSLKEDFSPELAAGTVQWRSVDYKGFEELGNRLGVQPPCVVVAAPRSGKADSYQPLEELWMYKDDRAAFRALLTRSVREAIQK